MFYRVEQRLHTLSQNAIVNDTNREYGFILEDLASHH